MGTKQIFLGRMGNIINNYEWIRADWKGSIKWKGEGKKGHNISDSERDS